MWEASEWPWLALPTSDHEVLRSNPTGGRFFFFFNFFFFIWVLWPLKEYFTYIEPNIHQRWGKIGEHRGKTTWPSICRTWLSIIWPERGPASVAQLDAPSDWRPGGCGFNPRRGRQHSFVEIDHEIFSTVILSLPLIQEGQLSFSGERMCTILVNR